MDWNEILNLIIKTCLIPLLTVLTGYLVKFIQAKAESLKANIRNEKIRKYVSMLAQTISDCVIATNQTYTNALKEQDAFDAAAQKEAFNRTYNAVMAILTEEAKEYLEAIYGDLNAYITEKIEAEVNCNREDY